MPRRGENITKRKDGRWEARVIYAYDENNRAKYRYLYGKTYAEARAKKEHVQSTIVQCAHQIFPNAYTLEDLISEFLLHKQMTVKASTWAHYSYLLARYIPIHMAKLRLNHLNVAYIERTSLDLLQSGGENHSELSSKTVRDILELLRSVLRYGVRRKYVAADILEFSIPLLTPPKVSILDKEEQKALERFATDATDSFRAGVYLTLYTGLRLGELCALKWSDINLAESELYVRRSIQRIASGGGGKTEIVIDVPKTRTSVRTIPLPAFLTEHLAVQRNQISHEDAYFLTGKEAYIEPSNYYMKYQRWLKKLGIGHHSFHALRHTFATRCMESGIDVKSLSEILGHADVKITLNRYVHPTMELKHRQMEKLHALYSQSQLMS